MGMSASQARLLSITARLNDVEYKSQNIANIKIRLADESERLALNYSKAISQQKYTYTTYASGQAQKIDLTLQNLIRPGSKYTLVTNNGKIAVSQDQAFAYNIEVDCYNESSYGNAQASYVLQMKFGSDGNVMDDYRKNASALGYSDYGTSEAGSGFTFYLRKGLITQEEIDFYSKQYDILFKASSIKGGKQQADGIVTISNSALNDPAWLYNAIESGEFMLVDNSTGEQVTASNTIALSIETDTSKYAIAEAEYNAANMKINNKEKLLDNEMKKLDTEHNALQTEMDSIKNLIGKNIEKSFNLFS